MNKTLIAATAGVLAGLTIGAPVSAEAADAWRKYRGERTGELIVCEKVAGVPAIERDRHRIDGKTYVVTWCNGRNWGRR